MIQSARINTYVPRRLLNGRKPLGGHDGICWSCNTAKARPALRPLLKIWSEGVESTRSAKFDHVWLTLDQTYVPAGG